VTVENDARDAVLPLRCSAYSASLPWAAPSLADQMRPRRRRRARVRRVRTGFVHETEMSHLGHRDRGSERSPGASAENTGGISVAACSSSIAVVPLGIPGSQARNARPGRRRHEHGLTVQARSSAIFRARSQKPTRIAESAGRRRGNFRPFFEFPSAFPIFRRIPGAGVYPRAETGNW